MAYVYNPFTFGLDYTDRRILAPLEANIANVVIKASANEALSKQNRNKRNNDTNPRLQLLEAANTALEATVYGNHAGRITVLENRDLTDHGPDIAALQTSNTTLWSQVFDYNTPNIAELQVSNTAVWQELFDYQKPMFGIYGNRIDYVEDKTIEISRSGFRGQINVLQKDGSYSTRPEWTIFEGHFTANTNNEVQTLSTMLAVTLEDVFDVWSRFAFGTDAGIRLAANDKDAFQFNLPGNTDGLPANTISCKVNTNHIVGFISPDVTDDYEFEVEVRVSGKPEQDWWLAQNPGKPTTDSNYVFHDNDYMGVVLAYAIDPVTPTTHRILSAFRAQNNKHRTWQICVHEVSSVTPTGDDFIHIAWPGNPTNASLIFNASDLVTLSTVTDAAGDPWVPGTTANPPAGSAKDGPTDFGGTVIKVRRQGDNFKVWTTQYADLNPVSNDSTLIEFDLNMASLGNITDAAQLALPQFEKIGGAGDWFGDATNFAKRSTATGIDFTVLEHFKGPKPFGLTCQSQTGTTFDVLTMENYSATRAENFIFDLTADKVFVPDHHTGTYKHATTANLESELGRGRIIRDKTSNDVFYFNQEAKVVPLFRPGTIDHLTVQVDTLISLMSNTANQIANLYANVISGTPLQPL